MRRFRSAQSAPKAWGGSLAASPCITRWAAASRGGRSSFARLSAAILRPIATVTFFNARNAQSNYSHPGKQRGGGGRPGWQLSSDVSFAEPRILRCRSKRRKSVSGQNKMHSLQRNSSAGITEKFFDDEGNRNSDRQSWARQR